MSLSLAILYTPATGKPLRITYIANRAMLVDAALVAIAEADFRAERVSLADAELGRVERAECNRLKSILGELLLQDDPTPLGPEPVPVM
jgi:hypothetical protein